MSKNSKDNKIFTTMGHLIILLENVKKKIIMPQTHVLLTTYLKKSLGLKIQI